MKDTSSLMFLIKETIIGWFVLSDLLVTADLFHASLLNRCGFWCTDGVTSLFAVWEVFAELLSINPPWRLIIQSDLVSPQSKCTLINNRRQRDWTCLLISTKNKTRGTTLHQSSTLYSPFPPALTSDTHVCQLLDAGILRSSRRSSTNVRLLTKLPYSRAPGILNYFLLPNDVNVILSCKISQIVHVSKGFERVWALRTEAEVKLWLLLQIIS